MIPVVEGRMPLVIEADRVDDIEGALRLAKEYGLKIMINGGAEAWLAANDLAAAHVPVIAGAMNNIPTSFSDAEPASGERRDSEQGRRAGRDHRQQRRRR